MIVVGNLGILFAIAVLPFLGVGAGTVGVLVVGGEIISLTSMYKGADAQTKDRTKKKFLTGAHPEFRISRWSVRHSAKNVNFDQADG